MRPVRIKQLYVLAALEVEKARNINEKELAASHGLTLLGGGFAAGNTMSTVTHARNTLQGLVTRDSLDAKVCKHALQTLQYRQGYHMSATHSTPESVSFLLSSTSYAC